MTALKTEQPFADRLMGIKPWQFAALAAGLLSIFLFYPFLFQGMALNGNHDRADYAIPMHLLFSNAFKAFSLPQWNPYMFCGNTLFSGAGYIFFYPPHWPLWLLPGAALPLLLTASTMAHFWVFAFFLVLLLERTIKGRAAAGLCAAAVCLSNPVVTALASGEGMLMHFTWLLPLLYLRVTEKERSPSVNFLLATACAALMLLGSMIQMAVYALGFYALFSITMSLAEKQDSVRDRISALARPLWPLACAFLLAGPRLIPFFLSASGNIEHITLAAFIRRGGAGYAAVMRLFSGGFFGYDLGKPYPIPLNSYEAFNAFAGIVFILLALYGLRRLSKQLLPWAVCSLTAFVFALPTPLQFIQYLALGRAEVIYSRLAWFLPLFLAVPAGLALQELSTEDCQTRTKKAGMAGVLCAGVFIWMLFLFPGADSPSIWWARKSAAAFLLSSAIFITALLFADSRKVFLTAVAAAMLLDTAIALEGAANSSNKLFSPRIYPPLSDTEKSIAETFATRRDFRVYGASPNTADFACINAWLYNASGYDNAPPQRIVELYAYPARPGRVQARKVGPLNAAAIAFSSNSGIITPDSVFVPATRFLPRFSLFRKAIVETDPKTELSILNAAEPLPYDTILLEKAPRPLPLPGSGKVTLLREELNGMELAVESTAPTLVYIGDTWADGWTASVNDRPAEILRANYAFRAVAVEAGRSIVRMEYRARGLKTGFALALAGLALAAFLIVKLPKVSNN